MKGETNFRIKLFMSSMIFAFEHCSITLSTISESYRVEHSRDTILLQRFGYKCQNVNAASLQRCGVECINGFSTRFVRCAGLGYDHETQQCSICGENENHLDPALKRITELSGMVYISEYLMRPLP